MVAHSALTGAELHEPKGVASATDGHVAKALSSAVSWGTLVEGSLAAGMVSQIVFATPYTTHTTIGTIPYDNTIPQNTEGTEITTVTITPKATTNKLLIYAHASLGSSSQEALTLALFQDTTAGALCASAGYIFPDGGTNDSLIDVSLLHVMNAGTTSATTFKLRAGDDGGDGNINGTPAGRKYGGVAAANLIIIEVKV